MGTKVQYESYLPQYHSMRDLNEDSHGCSWPLYYGEKACQSGQYYNGIFPRATPDSYLGCDRDAVKRTMLEHEAIFKTQVYELHRLYRKQRELMNDFRRSEQRNQMPVDISFSSSPLASQNTLNGVRKWHLPSFPLVISSSGGPSVPGIEDIKSSLSSMKENNRNDGLLPSHNVTSSKDCEVLDSRPTKVRRKTFDLQLPAEEYIDSEEGEVFPDEKLPSISGCHSNGNKKFETQSCVTAKLYPGQRSSGQGDALQSDSSLWNRYGLADLNEPIQLEETNGSNFFDLPSGRDSCNGETQGPYLSTKQEILLNSSNESGNASNRVRYLDRKIRSETFPNVLEAGRSKGSEKSIAHVLQMEKFLSSSDPMQVPLEKFHELPVFYLTDKSKVRQEWDRPVSDLQFSKRSCEISNTGDPGYFLASQTPLTYPNAPSDVGKSWACSSSSWEKPNCNFSKKSTLVQTQLFFKSSASLHKNSCSSAQNNEIFGDRWHLSSDSRSNPGSGCETPYQNGFYLGSASGSKDGVLSSSARHDQPVNYFKGSGYAGMSSSKDINLNAVLSKSLANEAGQQSTFRIREVELKNEDHHAILPWSRATPATKNETTNSGRFSNTGELSFVLSPKNKFSDKNEAENGRKVLCFPSVKSDSHGGDIERRTLDLSECQSNRKLLGFPIFEGPHISKNESFSLTSPLVSLPNPSESEVEDNWKTRMFDINLPCDPSIPESDNTITAGALAIENGQAAKISTVRHYIDLNSCVDEEEASLRPSASSAKKKKVVVEIDLETLAVPETEEDVIRAEESVYKQREQQLQSPSHKAVNIQDYELMTVAAEAIIAISSCGHYYHLDDSICNELEDSSSDPLNWFADIVSTRGYDLETKSDTLSRGKDAKDNEESSLEGIDYFEYMCLRQPEVKEEDYMPKPLVPESIEFEDTRSNLLQSRPRKGQTRRGRQRRDFQRDILPGLSSLSRHEVTEDLQTFGSLMRATGHAWHSGATRRSSTRNGCGRGRRRSVISPPPPPVNSACNQLMQQLSNIEMGLEDGSLTGWGKTTRRPRRQRCPAGVPPPVPLT